MENKNNKNFSKFFKTITILSLILVLYLEFNYANLKTELSSKENQIKILNSSITYQKQQLNDYKTKNERYEKQIRFMDNSVVICPADGTSIYHNYNCTHYDKTIAYLVFNPENAKTQGFNPCYYCSNLNSTSDKKVEIVYVTNTGTKYHKSGCSYLKSSNPITKKKALEQGYSACSRCNP